MLLTNREQGSTTLWLSLLVLVISLSIAIWVTWQQLEPTEVPVEEPTTTNDVLLPQLLLDESLASQQAEYERSLFQPLRNYYATQDEFLGNVQVEPGNEEYRARVTYTLSSNGEQRAITFLYGPTDEDLPLWEPSFLDNTE